MTDTTDPATQAGVARLRVERALRGDVEAVCVALGDPAWLGQIGEPPPEHPELSRIETDLAFPLTDEPRTIAFRKAAFVDLGPVRRTPAGCVADISWRASSFAPLFPVFAGRIEVSETRLLLTGVYAPPGGGVGLLVDRSFLRVFARRTAAWFLDRLAAEISAA